MPGLCRPSACLCPLRRTALVGGCRALRVLDSPVSLKVPKKLVCGTSAVGVEVEQPQPHGDWTLQLATTCTSSPSCTVLWGPRLGPKHLSRGSAEVGAPAGKGSSISNPLLV